MDLRAIQDQAVEVVAAQVARPRAEIESLIDKDELAFITRLYSGDQTPGISIDEKLRPAVLLAVLCGVYHFKCIRRPELVSRADLNVRMYAIYASAYDLLLDNSMSTTQDLTWFFLGLKELSSEAIKHFRPLGKKQIRRADFSSQKPPLYKGSIRDPLGFFNANYMQPPDKYPNLIPSDIRRFDRKLYQAMESWCSRKKLRMADLFPALKGGSKP